MEPIKNIQNNYGQSSLDLNDLFENPLKQFAHWFAEATTGPVPEANAMILSTVGPYNKPSSRLLLLKGCDRNGLTFFTNYESKKSRQLEANAYACVLFPWHEMQRQVRIEGEIQKTSDKESDIYFASRPKGHQIGAWVSAQSREIKSRKELEDLERKYNNLFAGKKIPRPPFWGGYRLVPDLFEFWQGRENRLHDRFEYYQSGSGWKIRRLAP